jgi:subtilase family serine protease
VHDVCQVRDLRAATEGEKAVAKRLRFVLFALVLALAGTSVASAATVRPQLHSTAFTPLQQLKPGEASTLCLNGLSCYVPQEIQAAYNYPQGSGAPTGAGQTIVVVTSYGAPFVATDLRIFDAGLGLPDPPHFRVETQKTPISGEGSGATYVWQVETDLDVQWAHAMAPGANIVVAVADTDDPANVAEVLREVVPKYPGAIVTQSFGADETGPAGDPTLPKTFGPLYLAILLHGGTVLAAAGDLGASNGTEIEQALGAPLAPSAMAAYPASDPLVLAVGGTEGDPYPGGLLTSSGSYGGEQVWNEAFPGAAGATGGAPSRLFDAPPWQRSLHTKQRVEPDVSYNASNEDGYLVILSCRPLRSDPSVLDPTCVDSSNFGFVSVGGTSAGAPQWAAIVALANELRARGHRLPAGFVGPTLYQIAQDPRAYARDFHDITQGDNALDLTALGFPAASQFGFAAAPGYDIPTGLGTPNVTNLLNDLQLRDPSFNGLLGLANHSFSENGQGVGGKHRFEP